MACAPTVRSGAWPRAAHYVDRICAGRRFVALVSGNPARVAAIEGDQGVSLPPIAISTALEALDGPVSLTCTGRAGRTASWRGRAQREGDPTV